MLSNLKIFVKLLDKGSRKKFYVFSILRLIAGTLDIIGVFLVGLLLARSVGQITNDSDSKTATGFSFVPALESFSLLQLATVATLAFISKSFFSAILTKSMLNNFAKNESDIATNAFSYILSNMSWATKKYSKSDLNYLLGYSVSAVLEILAIAVIVFTEISFLIAMMIVFLIVNPYTTFFMILYFSLISFFLYLFLGKKFQKSGAVVARSNILTTTAVYDTVESFREIVALRRETYFLDKYSEAKFQGSKAGFYAQYLNNIPRYIIESALIIGALGIVITSVQSENLEQSAQTIGIFITGATRIVASLLPVQTSLASYKHLISKAQIFIDFNSESKNLGKLARSKNLDYSELKTTEPVGVEIKNLTFSYGELENPTLKQLNLRINPGSLVAIIGPSGSGKSTLADLLIGILKPSYGEINYFTNTISEISLENFQFGYVPQNPGKIYGTIKENIAFGVEPVDVDDSILKESVINSHLLDVVSNLELGINTHLGEQTDALSGGQMQRIGLARALYVKPNFLILDEATSALDLETESAIADSLAHLKGKCTILVIAHRLSTVKNADNVFIMEAGEIVANGKFEELAKTNSTLMKYIELSELADFKMN